MPPSQVSESGDDRVSDTSDPDSPPRDDGSPERRPRTQRELPDANMRMSPLDLRFSQMRARHEFRDGLICDESAALIKAVRCEDDDGKPAWKLEPPFPPIEVLQWRCKLRGEDGRPKLDEETGEELWDNTDRWFTLDNRRLYCLQKAAIKVYPEKVLVDVIQLPSTHQMSRLRELKKFRTMDRGRSVMIGGRKEGETLVRWSWREAAGLAAAPDGQDSDDLAQGSEQGTPPRRMPSSDDLGGDRVQLRARKKYTSGGRAHGGGQSGGRSSSNSSREQWSNNKRQNSSASGEDSETEGRFSQMSFGSLVVFLGIYVLLRFGTKLVTALGAGERKGTVTEAIAASDTPLVSTLLTGGAAALIAT